MSMVPRALVTWLSRQTRKTGDSLYGEPDQQTG
jgi:hypothetical protein